MSKWFAKSSLKLSKSIGKGDKKSQAFRITCMGSAGVGKSAIISRFLYEEFVEEYEATVEELHRGEYEINGSHLTLDILDTSGYYEFPAMRKLAISTGDAFILVYSVDSESSFEEVKRLRELILTEKNDEHVPIVIVGNKVDIPEEKRQVSKEAADITVSVGWENGHVEASAKDNVNIVGIFKELLAQANVKYNLSPAVRRRTVSMSAKCSSPKEKISKQSCSNC